jgi:peroxiredoxin
MAISVVGGLALTSGKHVPSASFTLLNGKKISTSDLKGNVYLINFWETDCDTCIQEMPEMIKTYNQFKDQGFGLIAVAMNSDTPSYVRNYAKSRALPFMVAIDDGRAGKQFGNVQLTPTTFLVNREGRILKRYVGQPSFVEMRQLIQQALKKTT